MTLALAVSLVTLAHAAAGGAAAPAPGARAFDFDRDGRQELVAAAPGWTVGGAPNAGAVFVVSARGARVRARLLTEASRGVPGRPSGDHDWGAAVASADFDGDRYADLAVAAPGEGIVAILHGSRGGLRAPRGRLIRTMTATLAAGDLDRDGYGDLAMGDDGGLDREGSVRLFFGGRDGLRRSRTLAVPRPTDDRFGTVLAVGDVDADGSLDLVEAAPGNIVNIDGQALAGHASYCAGGRAGPRRCVPIGEPFEGGPTAIAVGDVTCDGYADIVGGSPVDRFVGEDDVQPSGALRVWRGTARGPQPVPDVVTQELLGLPEPQQPAAAFGASVLATRFDADACADIVAGAPGEGAGSGRVVVIRGTGGAVGSAGVRVLTEDDPGIAGRRAPGHAFGAAVTAVDLAGDRRPDLVVGAPGDRSLTILPASRDGVDSRLARRVTPQRFGIDVPVDAPGMGPSFGGLLPAPAAR